MIIDENKIVFGLIGLVSSIFWYWLHSRDKRFEKIETEMRRIEHDYQRKESAEHDFTIMMGLLNEIKGQLTRLNDKLDRKADK